VGEVVEWEVVEWEGGRVEECKREREAAQNKSAVARSNQVNKHVLCPDPESANKHRVVKGETKSDVGPTRTFTPLQPSLTPLVHDLFRLC
jgi:hypothetical protein